MASEREDGGSTKRSNPYVGPQSFERDDGKYFFGREREAKELLSLLVARRLVLFYAESGAGKSSLINAKLTPDLEDRGFEVLSSSRIASVLSVS